MRCNDLILVRRADFNRAARDLHHLGTGHRMTAPKIGRATRQDGDAGIPLGIGAPPTLPTGSADEIRETIGRAMARYGAHIQRVLVRLEEGAGPRQGADWLCRIKVALDEPDEVVVEERGASAMLAFANAVPSATRAVSRALGRAAPAAAPRRAAPARRAPSGGR